MWLQHFMKNLYLGSELTEEQLKDIPYPREELHFYVLHKNIQVGCLLGGLIGSIRGLYKGRSIKSMIEVAYKGHKLGCLIMTPASPIITEAWLKHKNATEESIFHRSFKLRSNKREMRAYRYSTYSAILGSGTSLIYNRTVLPGLLFGISAGTLAGFVQNTKEKLAT